MNIVIAGAGKVGTAITQQLVALDHEITIIDMNKRVIENALERFDVSAYNGNCASMETLKAVNIQEADVLIVTTGADEVNLLCCMTAHELNKTLHTIARVRNPQYMDQIFQMRDVFGLSMLINPERQAAREIEGLLQFPGTLKRDTFAKGRVDIVELRVKPDGKLDGLMLAKLSALVHTTVLVCSVIRNGNAFIPKGDFCFEAGDRVFITAPTANLTEMLRRLEIGKKRMRRVMLCGGGRLSFYLAQRLLRSGIDVTVIEQDNERCRELVELLPGAEIMRGDASDPMLLDSEEIGKYDALVSLTGMDELNIIISMYAKNAGVGQVITKLAHITNLQVLQTLPLDSVISPKQLCAHNIVSYVNGVKGDKDAVIAEHDIADGHSKAREFRVDDMTRHKGVPIRALSLKRDVLIVCIQHGANVIIPNGNSYYENGDTVIVVSDDDTTITRLNDIFKD